MNNIYKQQVITIMDNNIIKTLKGSEAYKITVAVMEIMESAGFETSYTANTLESTKKGMLTMSFYKPRTTVEELNSIQYELGEDFNITVKCKDKSFPQIVLEAPVEGFLKLIKKGVNKNFPDVGGEGSKSEKKNTDV